MNNETQKSERGITVKAGMVRVSSVGWMVKMVAHLMDHSMGETLAPLGVTVDQFKVVMTLTEFDGQSQVEIGKKISLPSYAITRLLDSMETSGLVQRHPVEGSGRSFSIRLTRKGKALAPKLFKAVVSVNEQVLGPLSANEKKQLSQLLEKIIPRNLKETNEPESD